MRLGRGARRGRDRNATHIGACHLHLAPVVPVGTMGSVNLVGFQDDDAVEGRSFPNRKTHEIPYPGARCLFWTGGSSGGHLQSP